MVEVCAISFPEFKWLKNVVAFTKASFHDESYFEIYKNLKDEEVEPFLTKIIEMGHESVLEHITFTFLIFDISRWATHQLVRHRIASYTQKSLRKERPIEPDMFLIFLFSLSAFTPRNGMASMISSCSARLSICLTYWHK